MRTQRRLRGVRVSSARYALATRSTSLVVRTMLNSRSVIGPAQSRAQWRARWRGRDTQQGRAASAVRTYPLAVGRSDVVAVAAREARRVAAAQLVLAEDAVEHDPRLAVLNHVPRSTRAVLARG